MAAAPPDLLLRPPRVGELGWLVYRQAVLYAEEYGFDQRFEGLLAEIVGQFVRSHDPARERCWIAERGGAVAGSVFLCRVDGAVGKLRMLYVEPAARGHGIGRALIEECIRTARALGYQRLTLWTNDIHVAARALYERAGFTMTASEPLADFGREMAAETWELPLSSP